MRFLVAFMILIFLSCSIKSPEFTITGQKTNLEQQVLGSYQRLQDDAIVTTSARTTTDIAKENGQQQAILQAMKNQRFNKDEIDELKSEHVIGEDNQGFLQVRSTEKYEKDEKYRTLVDGLVETENSDRHIIYQRVLLMNDIKDADQTSAIFATMQIEQSRPGTLIQLSNGEWIEKPKDEK